VNEGTVEVSLTPTLFDPGRNRLGRSLRGWSPGVSGHQTPESPGCKTRSLRPALTRSHSYEFEHVSSKDEVVSDERDRLGSERGH
jgi:hypothetical protein